jgi:hypothetical protein
MVLEKDVLSHRGNLILKEGTILTETWIKRLGNFARARAAQTPADVRIPKLAGVRKLEEFGPGPSQVALGSEEFANAVTHL